MFHGQYGKFSTHHAAYFSGPKTTGIDDMFSRHIAFIGGDVPNTFGMVPFQAFYLTLQLNFCAANLGR